MNRFLNKLKITKHILKIIAFSSSHNFGKIKINKLKIIKYS